MTPLLYVVLAVIFSGFYITFLWHMGHKMADYDDNPDSPLAWLAYLTIGIYCGGFWFLFAPLSLIVGTLYGIATLISRKVNHDRNSV